MTNLLPSDFATSAFYSTKLKKGETQVVEQCGKVQIQYRFMVHGTANLPLQCPFFCHPMKENKRNHMIVL